MSLPPVEIEDESGATVISISETESWRRRLAGGPCKHRRVLADAMESELTCRDCKAKINPVVWLLDLRDQWADVQRLYVAQRRAAETLATRSRFKCEHCNRISAVRHPTSAEVRAWDEQERSRRIKGGSLIIVDSSPAGAPSGGEGER